VERVRRAELQRALTRLADGERAAFRPVFDLAWPRVREVAGRLLSNPADAEDAAQCALLKVFARASDFDRQRDALAWIIAIASYECLTLRRKASRRREAGGDGLMVLADPRESQEQRAMTAQLEEVALAVLGELRPDDRETLRVAIFGEGERTGKAATFRKRLERALGRLRAAWRDHGIG
jgi:RNA polymerase sigma-70 factor (ECF subfamily)